MKISLPAVLQHVQVLERSGLVRSEKVGRVRTCRIEERFDRLGDYLATGSLLDALGVELQREPANR